MMRKFTTHGFTLVMVWVVLLHTGQPPVAAQDGPDYWPTEGWQTSTPEEQGMDSVLLEEMMALIDTTDLPVDSVVIVRHGYIVWEEYLNPAFSPNAKHILYSVTKSVTSALVGTAIEEGFIEGTGQRVVDFFPDRTIANLDARKQNVTLEHLLTMSAGFEWEGPDDRLHTWGEALTSRNPVQFTLDQPMAYEPGTVWYYNGGCSHLLSAIITGTTGQSTLDFALEHLFEPLGITDVRWPIDPEGIYFGGQDIWLRPRDMAKFGYLYLNNGTWDGQQIIPAEWVARSTATAFSLGPTQGYGYQWWTYPELGVYYAAGAFEQRIFVVPDLDLVVVFTSNNQLPGAAQGEIREGPEFTPELLIQYILPAVDGYVP